MKKFELDLYASLYGTLRFSPQENVSGELSVLYELMYFADLL